MKKTKKSCLKKAGDTVKILGVRINSTELVEVLGEIGKRIQTGQKTFIVTPNPEFIVFSQAQPWFKNILNKANFAIPDGIGLVWASRILGQPLKKRVSGADLAEKLLLLAKINGWRIGVVGARKGNSEERRQMIRILQKKYQGAKIAALEETGGWQKQKWEIIFACQGMGEQEIWVDKNFSKINALVFIGVGGALDFLTGFAKRAPVWIRKIGFEWLFRLFRQPWRARRQLSLIRFVWLTLKERYTIL